MASPMAIRKIVQIGTYFLQQTSMVLATWEVLARGKL
jgi:hypothetical protein